MARFNHKTYSPVKDSSPGSEIYRARPDDSDDNPGYEGVILLVEPGQCKCGCGLAPNSKKAQFRAGHDARLKGILQRAHLMGTEVTRIDGGSSISASAMSFAAEFSWTHLLDQAVEANADRIRRANERLLKKATGPQKGDRKLIKVGRWEYTGQVVAVYQDGSEIVFEYVTKKGETKTATQYADGRVIQGRS